MRDRILWIEAMRGIAAFAVVLWHGTNFIAPYGTGTIAWLLQPGAVFGVDIFFLISGFVMAHVALRPYTTPRQFLASRAARVAPIYYVAIIAVIIASKDFPTWYRLVMNLLFLPSAPDQFPILVVGWTLNYEIYFYLAFAAALLAGKWKWVALALWFFLATVVLPLLPKAFPGIEHPWTMFIAFFSNNIILFFAVGCVCGILHEKVSPIARGWKADLVRGCALLLVAAQYFSHFRIEHTVWESGLSLVPLMVCFSLTRGSFSAPNALVWLGKISYSLYLSHMVVFIGLGWPRELGRDGYMPMSIAVGLCVLVGWLTWRYIELPLTDRVRSLLLPSKKLASSAP